MNLVTIGLFIVICVGSLLIDNTNIDDQENGRMPMGGSWWDGFEDSYGRNIWDKWVTWLLLIVLGGCFVYNAVKPVLPPPVMTSAPVKSKVASAAKHAHKASHRHH